MKAILVDDEQLPLQHLEHMLKNEFNNIEIIGIYSNPLEAEKMIKRLQPDLVFLDIEMPGLNGLQLGESIQETCPEIEIIFVTAFDKYAVQAFELYAIDYMMKPIRLQRLRETIGRLEKKRNDYPKENTTQKKSLSFFQTIRVQYPNGKKELMKWRTAKAQELFAYLLHYRGHIVYRDTILELLWPDFDLDRGVKQLYTTIYHIRQTLKTYELEEVIISRIQLDNGYRLDIGELEIDTERWKNQVLDTQLTMEDTERLLQTYEGDYLGEHDYVWAGGERERLKSLFLTYAEQLHVHYMKQKMIEEAIKLNEYIKQYSLIEEISYFNLMKLYATVENEAAVHDQYKQLTIVLDEQLDILPSEEIINWYKEWTNIPC